MTRTVLVNLGFEYELAGRPVPRVVRRFERRFAHILRLVPGWRDADLHTAASVPDQVLAWGCSAPARGLAGDAARDWPRPELVRDVNDKRFSHRVEQQLGVALDGAKIVETVAQAAALARAHGGRWLLKHPFGVAGRDQVRGEHWNDDEHAGRTAGLLATAEVGEARGLVFEPWVDIDRELSLHFDLDDSGVRPCGAVGLLSDHHGTFRGNYTAVDVPAEVTAQAGRAAALVYETGYRGPLGVDAFIGACGLGRVVRPVSELNARWTFGRLTLELARALGRDIAWHHALNTDRPACLEPAPPDSCEGAWLLPEWCDPRADSGTWIEVVNERGEN